VGEIKYTPEPWTASKPDDAYFDDWNICRADGLAVAAVVQNGDIDPATVEANAHLIAAAPAMLAALTSMVPPALCGETWGLPPEERVEITITFGTLSAARAAIAKASGSSRGEGG